MKSEGKAFSVLIGCEYFETSAKTRVNIEESFHYVVREQLKAIKNPKYFTQKQKRNEGIRLLIGRGWFEMLSTIYRVENKNIEMPLINKNLKNVWILIFSFVCCDENEKMNARLVCKYWNELISNHFRLDENNLKGKRKRTQMKSIVSDHFKIVASDWYMPIIYDNVSHVVVFVDATDIDKPIDVIENYNYFYDKSYNKILISLLIISKNLNLIAKWLFIILKRLIKKMKRKSRNCFPSMKQCLFPICFPKIMFQKYFQKQTFQTLFQTKKVLLSNPFQNLIIHLICFRFVILPKNRWKKKCFKLSQKWTKTK